ncbi:hypothetical protein KOW79_001724 [Hemibagrus wyckioides]|uniref:Uncharacterized protein n=1 Tax=Hemibagrus wyckioides TaxID=337641 RepID=A0A9D3P947_9TELE|nr:hypothetical protein KOW79_001724 [Hemibagrus wyckioides]
MKLPEVKFSLEGAVERGLYCHRSNEGADGLTQYEKAARFDGLYPQTGALGRPQALPYPSRDPTGSALRVRYCLF